MTRYSDKRLAELLAVLPPAPEAWIARAERIPSEHGVLGQILARAANDPAFRTALLDDAAGALERAGFATDVETLETLREQLPLDDPPS